MKPEFPRIDQDKTVSPHAQEVECALILSQMINTVREDPTQMRLAIYEFARARLKIDMSWAEEAERTRLSAALERAIEGVEDFSARQEERERLQPPSPTARIEGRTSPAEPSTSMVTLELANSVPKGVLVAKEAHLRGRGQPIVELQTLVPASRMGWFGTGIVVFGLIAGLVIYENRLPILRVAANVLSAMGLETAKPTMQPSIPVQPQQFPGGVDIKTAAASSSSLPFPLPSDYGVYAVSNTALSELRLLPEQVPDKRVALSTPINQPSRTFLPDGKAKFVVFRRDLAGNAPDRIDVRVVAKVMRALTFDAKGKASFSPVSDAWNIRNVSYEFRVRPIAGNPEMLLVQAEKADFALPAGRYVLALKNQGYDFTVNGKITDPMQCLERTEAANGEFYSDCQKQ
jgi:hypothetical protein